MNSACKIHCIFKPEEDEFILTVESFESQEIVETTELALDPENFSRMMEYLELVKSNATEYMKKHGRIKRREGEENIDLDSRN